LNSIDDDSSSSSCQSNKRKFFTLYQSNSKRNTSNNNHNADTGSKSSIFWKGGTSTRGGGGDGTTTTTTTTTTEAPSEIDKKLAQELNDLSLEERTKVMEEVHGVATIPDEDPVMIHQKLIELETELTWIGKRQKVAYERALFLSPIRVRDRAFRMAFLRAEEFDASKAAKRLVKYFEYKLELFGSQRLVEPITLEDLDPDDMEALLTGSFQVQSDWKDQSGRTVAFLSSANYKYKKPMNQVRDDDDDEETCVFGAKFSKRERKRPHGLWFLVELLWFCFFLAMTCLFFMVVVVGSCSFFFLLLTPFPNNRFFLSWHALSQFSTILQPHRPPPEKKKVKMNWYLIMAALEDESVQKYGLVHVLYDIGLNQHDVIYADLLTSIHIIRDGLPFRLPALHYCFDKAMMRGAMSLLQTMISKNQRLRFRAHFGSPLECEYALVGFGVPKSLSPYDDNGNWTRHKLLDYLETRRSVEGARRGNTTTTSTTTTTTTSPVEAYYHSAESLPLVVSSSSATSATTPARDLGDSDSVTNNNNTKNSADQQPSSSSDTTLIEAPGPNDILLGRGRPYQEYEGNQILATFIDQYREEYQESDRFGKTCISKMVLQMVKKQKGARFLQRALGDSHLWIEVSDAVAREKISHSFRTKNKRSSTSDSTTTNSSNNGSNNSNTNNHNNSNSSNNHNSSNNTSNHIHSSQPSSMTTQYDTVVSSSPNPGLFSFWNWQQQPPQPQPATTTNQLVPSFHSNANGSSVTTYPFLQGQLQ
jgi:hypothetical protein